MVLDILAEYVFSSTHREAIYTRVRGMTVSRNWRQVGLC